MRSCKLVLKDPGILLCRLDSYLGYSWLYSWGWGCLLSPDCLAQMLAFCLSCQTSFQYVVAPVLSILKIEFCPDILMSLCNVFSIQMGSVVLNIQMSIQSSNDVPYTSILIVTIVFFINYRSLVLPNIMTESPCCFWKCNRHSRPRFCIMVYPKNLADL
jgi:hypothetical protein